MRNQVSTKAKKPSSHLVNSHSSFRTVQGPKVTFSRRPFQILPAPPAPDQVPVSSSYNTLYLITTFNYTIHSAMYVMEWVWYDINRRDVTPLD